MWSWWLTPRKHCCAQTHLKDPDQFGLVLGPHQASSGFVWKSNGTHVTATKLHTMNRYFLSLPATFLLLPAGSPTSSNPPPYCSHATRLQSLHGMAEHLDTWAAWTRHIVEISKGCLLLGWWAHLQIVANKKLGLVTLPHADECSWSVPWRKKNACHDTQLASQDANWINKGFHLRLVLTKTVFGSRSHKNVL